MKRHLARAVDKVHRLRAFVRRRALWQDQRGATAVEMALTLPVLIITLTGIIQMGGVFFLQNNMMSVAHDTARRVLVGELTATEAKTHAENGLINWGVTFNVQVTEPANDVVVNITAPLSEAMIVDYLGLFNSGNLKAEVTARK